MRRAAKVDANQPDVVKGLREAGLSVWITSSLPGGVDLVVGWPGGNLLVELKDGARPPSERKLTPAEERFHKGWQGPICIALCLEDILSVIGHMRKHKP